MHGGNQSGLGEQKPCSVLSKCVKGEQKWSAWFDFTSQVRSLPVLARDVRAAHSFLQCAFIFFHKRKAVRQARTASFPPHIRQLEILPPGLPALPSPCPASESPVAFLLSGQRSPASLRCRHESALQRHAVLQSSALPPDLRLTQVLFWPWTCTAPLR